MAGLAQELEWAVPAPVTHVGQLSLAPDPTPVRAREVEESPLSEPLRREHDHGIGPEATKRSRTTVLRRDGEATLDELLVGAWEGLSVHHLVACPVCSGTMAPRNEAAGGACGGCGAQLR